jgi:hypothetical protein
MRKSKKASRKARHLNRPTRDNFKFLVDWHVESSLNVLQLSPFH